MVSPLWKLLSQTAEHPLLKFMKTNMQSGELDFKYFQGWRLQNLSGKLDLEAFGTLSSYSKILFLI